MTDHLNEEQFAACAMNEEQVPETAAHLSACEACRAEVEAFRESVDSFNTASLAWSESQPAVSLRPLVRERRRQPAWAIASWATAACLALAGAISFGTHHQPATDARRFVVNADAEDSPAQIERDNKLLMAVAQETSAGTASALQEYGLDASTHPRVATPHAQDEND